MGAGGRLLRSETGTVAYRIELGLARVLVGKKFDTRAGLAPWPGAPANQGKKGPLTLDPRHSEAECVGFCPRWLSDTGLCRTLRMAGDQRHPLDGAARRGRGRQASRDNTRQISRIRCPGFHREASLTAEPAADQKRFLRPRYSRQLGEITQRQGDGDHSPAASAH